MIDLRHAKEYCKDFEKIENYYKAVKDTELYECHHRLETHNSDGEKRLVNISRQELIALGMYYDRPPKELIFLSCAEHNSLHHKGQKFTLSEEAKVKVSAVTKGTHWFNDGAKSIRAFECPDGFVPGRI